MARGRWQHHGILTIFEYPYFCFVCRPTEVRALLPVIRPLEKRLRTEEKRRHTNGGLMPRTSFAVAGLDDGTHQVRGCAGCRPMPRACTKRMCVDRRPLLRLSYSATSGCCHLPSAFRWHSTCQAPSGFVQHDAHFALGVRSSGQYMIARLNESQAPLLLGLKAAVEAEGQQNSAYPALCHWEPRPVWHSWTSEDHTSEKPSLFRSALAL